MFPMNFSCFFLELRASLKRTMSKPHKARKCKEAGQSSIAFRLTSSCWNDVARNIPQKIWYELPQARYIPRNYVANIVVFLILWFFDLNNSEDARDPRFPEKVFPNIIICMWPWGSLVAGAFHFRSLFDDFGATCQRGENRSQGLFGFAYLIFFLSTIYTGGAPGWGGAPRVGDKISNTLDSRSVGGFPH